jgi:hypothetical protein
MDETQDQSSLEKDSLAAEVMDDVTGDGASDEKTLDSNADESRGSDQEDLPLYAKEKIGKLQKRHRRDMQRMQEQINMLQSQQPGTETNTDSAMNPQAMNQQNPQYGGNGGGGMDEIIQRAVSQALQAKDAEGARLKQQQDQAHIAKQYQGLQNKLDIAADKYDDFQDVVMANDVPYTPAMRDAMLMIDNPGDVLYKLGKNRSELERIAKLPSLDQAKEMIKLSHALMGGEKSSPQTPKTLGQVKSMPANASRDVTDKTSIGDIRARMKQGTFR